YAKKFLEEEYKKYNIGSGQYQFLIYLYYKDGVSHDELTERLSVDKVVTTRSIAKLEEEGYIRRELKSDDKRKYKIYLTEKAMNLKSDIFKISDKLEGKFTENLSDKDTEDLFRILRTISNTIPGNYFSIKE
ncbi:MAG: MarR family winged helix-turn-helix transcriptional regulator, partial [Paraclostridium sp.]